VKGDNTKRRDEFGSSLAVSRDGRTLVVGSRLQGDRADGAGAVYVFAFDNRAGTF